MRTIFLASVLVGSLAAAALVLTAAAPAAEAAGPKNLKVFPKNTSKKDLKKAMKGIAEALGQQCDYCHDLDDMAKDTERKQAARAMMRMVKAINKRHFKGKPRVRCVTCHNGRKKPK